MNAHQLDIFLDSHEVTLANEVVAALCAHDSVRTAQSIARLRAEAPERPDLPVFDRLHAFLDLTREIHTAGLDADALELTVEVLKTRIVPAAGILGSAAKAFLEFLWLQLARAATHPFDRERPHLHAAELFLRAQAYEAAEAAAVGIAGAEAERAVLHWRSVARYRLAGLKAAWPQILALAWGAPDAFPDLLQELGDSQLDKDWLAFKAETEDHGNEWLPAWYLLRHPEASAEMGGERASGLPPAIESMPARQAFGLLTRILDLEKQGHSRTLIEYRARLKATDAGFFATYMRSREVQHR